MSCIKSIQRGTDSGNKTIAISAVSINKSIALISGGTGTIDAYHGGAVRVPTIQLTNSTTLTVDSAQVDLYDGNAVYTMKVSYAWQVIEFS